MSNIKRFEPFGNLERLGREMTRQMNSFFNQDSLTTLFNTDFFGGTSLSDVAKRFTTGNVIENPLTRPFAPHTDIAEDDNNIYLHIELPGMDKTDVSVSVADNRTLTVKGERKNEFKEEGKNFIRTERSFGAFERSFTLPANIIADAVEAHFDNGILSLTLPKNEADKLNRITVEIR